MSRAYQIVAVAMLLTASWASRAATFLPMDDVIAINVLLELDERASHAAVAANRHIVDAHEASFAFDATHVPHVSLLHLYVHRADLPAIYRAVDEVDTAPAAITLDATGYTTSPWQDGTLVNMAIAKSDALDQLQRKLVDRLQHYRVTRAGETAFARTVEMPHIDRMTIDYVATFIPKQTGAAFKPHITLGMTEASNAEKWLSAPFARFEFHPAAMAIYQLGNDGTARIRLHEVS